MVVHLSKSRVGKATAVLALLSHTAVYADPAPVQQPAEKNGRQLPEINTSADNRILKPRLRGTLRKRELLEEAAASNLLPSSNLMQKQELLQELQLHKKENDGALEKLQRTSEQELSPKPRLRGTLRKREQEQAAAMSAAKVKLQDKLEGEGNKPTAANDDATATASNLMQVMKQQELHLHKHDHGVVPPQQLQDHLVQAGSNENISQDHLVPKPRLRGTLRKRAEREMKLKSAPDGGAETKELLTVPATSDDNVTEQHEINTKVTASSTTSTLQKLEQREQQKHDLQQNHKFETFMLESKSYLKEKFEELSSSMGKKLDEIVDDYVQPFFKSAEEKTVELANEALTGAVQSFTETTTNGPDEGSFWARFQKQEFAEGGFGDQIGDEVVALGRV
ncbi:unnamed protein product [Amoebophrya sp. A120]|nr:unnamed protein product [Amoebophrya sp. A120]|eukprot:GSA120T00009744001.1